MENSINLTIVWQTSLQQAFLSDNRLRRRLKCDRSQSKRETFFYLFWTFKIWENVGYIFPSYFICFCDPGEVTSTKTTLPKLAWRTYFGFHILRTELIDLLFSRNYTRTHAINCQTSLDRARTPWTARAWPLPCSEPPRNLHTHCLPTRGPQVCPRPTGRRSWGRPWTSLSAPQFCSADHRWTSPWKSQNWRRKLCL